MITRAKTSAAKHTLGGAADAANVTAGNRPALCEGAGNAPGPHKPRKLGSTPSLATTFAEIIQPREPSRLTRMSDVVRAFNRTRVDRLVVVLCDCGRVFGVVASVWEDGSKRPKTCVACVKLSPNRKRMRFLPRRESDIMPYYQERRR